MVAKGPICRKIKRMRSPRLLLAALVTVSSPLLAQIAISNTSLPYGGVGQSYLAPITVTGSTDYTVKVTPTPPAPGLTFNGDLHRIEGEPTSAGAFPVTVTATDGQTQVVVSKEFTIFVMQISTSPQLPSADTCSNYSESFAVTDGPPPPYNWSFLTEFFQVTSRATGGPPPGLTLNATTGVLSGTPTTAGQYNFTIEALSQSANVYATQSFSITVSSLCFFSNPLLNGDLNSFYRESLIVAGGVAPLTWTVKGGDLPPGITINSSSGLLSGTPTALGLYNFTIQVVDNTGATATQSFSITINPALAFTTVSPLPGGTAGVSYSTTFAATGGVAPYVFSTQDAPQGLSLSPQGVLSGMPSMGTYNITVTVNDSANYSVSMNFVVTFVSAGPLLQVSPTALTFSAPFEGDSPSPQFIDVVPVGTQPMNFHVLVDGGAGVPAPSWITVTPLTATAPARLVVTVNQGTLAAQTSNARVQVIDLSGNATVVTVTLNIASASPALQVTPDTLHFSALSAVPGTLVETLGLRSSGGGGPVGFTTAIQDNSPWITGVTPSSGSTVPNSTVFLQVKINTQGLQVGSYHDVILISSTSAPVATPVSVPVALFVSGSGAILDLSVFGERFQARSGGGFSNPQTVQILDAGVSGSSLAWTATFMSGSQYFSLSASSGNASPGNPGTLVVQPTASALQMAAGGYYGLLKISSTALNSPLYVVLVLDLADPSAPPLPDPSPAGVVFIGPAGQPVSAGQTVNINTSSATPVPYSLSVLTSDGGNWLTVNPSTGTATGQSPGQMTLTVDATQLAAGIYNGEVDVAMSGALRSVTVTFIVQPGGAAVNKTAPRAVQQASSCTPSALALTETSLANNFAIPAGWPAALIVQLNDDCGNTISNGSVSASFSNGDSPLMLRGTEAGAYSATWQPGVVSSQMTITLQGQSQSTALKPAMIQLIGSINQNQNAPPVISENGTVNTFNRVPAGALAPGMIVEVYGTGLATAKGQTGGLPLPTSFQGTSLIVGPYQAPLYYVSGSQVNVEFAAELIPNQQYPVIASLNGALSVPVITDIAPIQLGVAANSNGMVIAQHGVGNAYVTEASPAAQGEVVVIYLSGMGTTNPAVKSGEPAPSSPPAEVTVQPTVTLDGQAASVQFAGLTPGFVGLYQVNFQVPSNAGTGDLPLTVSQNGVPSNATFLPVTK
jgi:uncharacterized protein (TIGR03437 family)